MNSVRNGGDPGGWLSYLNYIDWAGIRQAAVDAGLDAAEMEQQIVDAIWAYIGRHGTALTQGEYVSILTATEGLTGTPKEGDYHTRSDNVFPIRYGDIVYRLYTVNPSMFAYVVLNELPEEQRSEVLDFFRYEGRDGIEWDRGGFPYRKQAPDPEEAIAQLERDLEKSVTASPEEMVLTQRGQSFQFLPENAYGVYAATYSSSNPEVAGVTQDGTVTALNYGEAYITLHIENTQGQHDLFCHVRCELDGGAEAAAASIRSQVEAGISPSQWIPLLEEISWSDLSVPGEAHDWINDVQQALYSYILTKRDRTGSTLPDDERLTLLSCTDGLDGAYSEMYSALLYAIYNLHPSAAARDILRYLSPEQQERALGLLLFEWDYHHRLSYDLSYEEKLDLLREQLEADRNNSLPLYPDALLFTSVGTVYQIHLARPYDSVYVSCESSNPEVAAVEARGDGIFDVTAAGPGEAAITVHCRNGGEDRDAVCSVFCSW